MPKRVDHEQRRRQIADALLRLAARRGLSAVTFRDVAAEAGVSVRLVQYYFDTKEQLVSRSLGYLALRLDARIKAAAVGRTLTRREVVEIVLTSVLPLDEARREDALASAAAYGLALTDPAVAAAGVGYPAGLVRYLAGVLEQARGTGELRDVDPATEAPLLLAVTNGLTSAVLGGLHSPDEALALLRHQLDRVLI